MNQLQKKAIIFDLDGTLYDQKRLRIRMAGKLLLYYTGHPGRIGDLRLLARFRRLREEKQYSALSIDELCAILDDRFRREKGTASRVMQYWMFQVPLGLVRSNAYSEVLNFAKKYQSEGGRVYIYSDYPVTEKLQALELHPDGTFVSCSSSELPEQKPSETAMQSILSIINLPADDILYVGDRDDRDRASAEQVGMEYMDIRDFREYI